MLVFDLTRRDTFEAAASWLTDLRAIAEEGVVVILVGNKLDLCNDDDGATRTKEDKRQISRAEAEQWCRQNNILAYVETSAKSGANVEEAFLNVAQKIYEGIEAGKYDLQDRRSGVKAASSMAGGGRVSLNQRRGQPVQSGYCC
jgi:Ras-related protein Rab-2A